MAKAKWTSKLSAERLDYYFNLRKNMQSFLSGERRKGSNVPENLMPKIPKRIDEGSIKNLERKALNKYEKLKEKITGAHGESYREVAYERRKQGAEARQKVTDYETGEIMTKKQYAENVIGNYYDELSDFNDAFANYMKSYIDELKRRYSPWDVAMMINQMAEDGVLPSRWQMYTKEGAWSFTHEIFSYMPKIRSGEDVLAMDAYSRSLMENSTEAFNSLREDYESERRRARQARRR